MCKRDVSDKDIDLSQKDVNKFKDEYRLWKEKGYLQTISFADNLNKHTGDFNKNNIRILKKHLKNTEYYLKKSCLSRPVWISVPASCTRLTGTHLTTSTMCGVLGLPRLRSTSSRGRCTLSGNSYNILP